MAIASIPPILPNPVVPECRVERDLAEHFRTRCMDVVEALYSEPSNLPGFHCILQTINE